MAVPASKVKELEKEVDSREPTWSELDSMPYSELEALSDRHQKIMTSGTHNAIREIAHLHARDLTPDKEGADWIQVLNYVDQKLADGELDALTVEEIHETNGFAPTFQRVKQDKVTGQVFNDEGLLIEGVRYYPSGAKVRTFHTTFKGPRAEGKWRRASQGQEYFCGLVEFIKEKFDYKNRLTGAEQHLSDGIRRAKPTRPLQSKNRSLDNVFIDGTDVQDAFASDMFNTDRKIEVLSEITDIDLITAYFSGEYRTTKAGKKLYSRKVSPIYKVPAFTARDAKRTVFEDILLRADKEFMRDLVDEGVVNSAGSVIIDEAFKMFYTAGDEKSEVLDLVGVDDDSGETYFTPFDLGLGNVMMTPADEGRTYAHIDFADSQEATLESLLAKRWCQAGIYSAEGSKKTSDGHSAEDALLDSAYKTVVALHEADGKEAPTKEAFRKRFAVNKKIQLLKNARRYKQFEERAKDNEELRATKRFFYTTFVNELAAEGKIIGVDDPKLSYLNTLFEEPLTQEELSDVCERFDPGFSSQEELSVLDYKDVDSKNKQLIKEYQRGKKIKNFLRGGLVLGLGALALAAITVYRTMDEQISEGAQENRVLEYRNGLKHRVAAVIGAEGITTNDVRSAQNTLNMIADRFNERFPDNDEYTNRKFARSFYLDHIGTHEAIMATGSSDWDVVRKYISDNNEELDRALYDVWDYVDSWMHSSSKEDATSWVNILEAEAKWAYLDKIADEAGCRRMNPPPEPNNGWECPEGYEKGMSGCVRLDVPEWTGKSDESRCPAFYTSTLRGCSTTVSGIIGDRRSGCDDPRDNSTPFGDYIPQNAQQKLNKHIQNKKGSRTGK